MGLFDFVKGIGKKNTAPAEPQAAPSTPAEPSAQEIANKLLGHIKALGLPVTGLSVSYNSTTDLATVKGQVQTQADKEKIVLAVGMWLALNLKVSSTQLNRGITYRKFPKHFMVMPTSTIKFLRPTVRY